MTTGEYNTDSAENRASSEAGHENAYESGGTSPPDIFGRYLANLAAGERERAITRVQHMAFRILHEGEDVDRPEGTDDALWQFVGHVTGLETIEQYEQALDDAQTVADEWRDDEDDPFGDDFLDLDENEPPPEYLIDRTVERYQVAILSGDTGSAKSIVGQWLAVAAARGEPWLGRDVYAQRVLYVDEENPTRTAMGRLRALGVRKRRWREALRYASRKGLTLGDGGASDRWLRRHVRSFKPDLLVIDTLMAATAAEDVNDNAAAVRMMKHLRALAEKHDCAVLVLHHERKQSKDNPKSSGQAAMGARQWIGQADAHMTLTVESEFVEEETDRGTFETRRTFKFRPAEKDREGGVNGVRRVAVTSEREANGRLIWMRVEDEGPVEGAVSREEQILRALEEADAPLTRAELAAICGERNPGNPSGAFTNALRAVKDDGRAVKPDRSHFDLSEGERTTRAVAF